MQAIAMSMANEHLEKKEIEPTCVPSLLCCCLVFTLSCLCVFGFFLLYATLLFIVLISPFTYFRLFC